MRETRYGTAAPIALPVLVFFLLAIGAALLYTMYGLPSAPTGAAQRVSEQYLAAGDQAPRQGFRIEDVPPWLFVHVAAIACLQVLALIGAYLLATGGFLNKHKLQTVQFLCEVPMYLGLFGTLLGVCLTQFITGSLVAPLAYLTTMSGIVLHVFGKLAIWLPAAGETEAEE